MPKLKTSLGKADYDSLEESLKSLYVPDGDNFKLDADFEDVSGLKAKRDELLEKVSGYSKTLKAFEGLDPEAAKAAMAKLGEIEDGQLLKKQQFDELFAKKKGEWDKEKESLVEKINGQTRRQAEQALALKLAAAGVKPKYVEDLATVLTQKHIKFVEDGEDVVWKTMDGLETVDLDTYIPGLKETKGTYFEASGASGSGATGSQQSSGNTNQIKRSQYDANPMQYAAALGKGEIKVVPD